MITRTITINGIEKYILQVHQDPFELKVFEKDNLDTPVSITSLASGILITITAERFKTDVDRILKAIGL